MADLFGQWIPDGWIKEVFHACNRAPWHTYLFLTKNPSRYIDLATKEQLPTHSNHWYGTTCTNGDTDLFYSEHHNTFLSVEPILADLGRQNVLAEAGI
jgi:protein gp37